MFLLKGKRRSCESSFRDYGYKIETTFKPLIYILVFLQGFSATLLLIFLSKYPHDANVVNGKELVILHAQSG